jgi:hypothetical protein
LLFKIKRSQPSAAPTGISDAPGASGLEWNHCEVVSLKGGMQHRTAKSSPVELPLRRAVMPWYAWLILVVAIGSIVGGLMMLRDTANKVELTDEERKRVAQRNAEADAKDAQDR